VYRADVLRFLPIGSDATKANYGKRLVNDADLLAHGEDFHTVTMPEPGSGNQVPATAGASLVVLYRDTRDDADPLTAGQQRPKLRSVVIYNGGWTMDQSTDFMSQKLKGFYQASTSNVIAKMTHIVGDGQANFGEQVLFNNSIIEPNPGPFAGLAGGPSSDPAWDNWTKYDLQLPAGASEATVRVDHGSFTPFDCLSWGAIILSTTVQDTDDDGLLDAWESQQSSGKLSDPNGVVLPDLYAMGARPNKKDVFVEIGYLHSTESYNNPFQNTVDPHTHLPTKAALDMVAKAFKNAPVSNPDGTTGINMHFDVGNNHQSPVEPHIIRWTNNASNLARGGEPILETECVPNTFNNFVCTFPKYRGIVGWKSGFNYLKNQPLLAGTTSFPTEEQCITAGNNCVRRFDRNRKDIFHYALIAHALGVQRLDDPNTPEDESVKDDPLTPENDPSPVPSGVSGTADGGGSGGGDLIVTLGFWDAFVGTDFVQASTLMHELGHNFGFRHGAGPPTLVGGTVIAEPNCKPNYQSVMNYMFQIRGLIVGLANSPVTGNVVGTSVIDYSRQTLPGTGSLSESGLTEQPTGLPNMLYRTGWYSPTSQLAADLTSSPAKRHCDGSFLDSGEVGAFRITGTSLTAIDWNANLVIEGGTNAPQDVNFNGNTADGPFTGGNDWAAIDLRQVGSRRNIASGAVTDFTGPLSLDQGQGDNGQGDNGQGDNGQGDNGQGDNGQGDNGQGDNGQGDNGQGDNGQGDNGAPPEVDIDTARALGDGANDLSGRMVGQRNAELRWFPPHVGKNDVANYEIWRVEGTVIDAATWQTRQLLGTQPPAATPPNIFLDTTRRNNIRSYTYFIIAVFNNGDRSGASSFVTVTR
jgi:hypothetical protein